MPVGAHLGRVRRPPPRPSARRPHPSAGLPSPAHPRPRRVRAVDRGPGARLRLRAHRQSGLLGPHHPAPPPGVGRRPAWPSRCTPWRCSLRPDDRPGAGGPGGGRLYHQGPRAAGDGRGGPGRPGQAGAQTLGGHRRRPASPCIWSSAGANRHDARCWGPRWRGWSKLGPLPADRHRPSGPRPTTAPRPARCWTSWASTARSPARACPRRSRRASAGWWSGRKRG